VTTPRRYDEAEVREILRRAIERDQDDAGRLGRSDIIAAAAEIGIDESSVQRAIVDIDRERELTDEVELLRLQRKSKWLSHVSTWAIVNAFLLAVNLLTGGAWWFYWPLMAWGIFVAMHTARVVMADDRRDRERAKKRLEKRRGQREKQARKEKKKAAEKELEQAIERGVHALLGAAAQRAEAVAEAISPKEQAGKRVRIDSDAEEHRGRAAEDEAAVAEAEAEAAAEEQALRRGG
jgi:hypothetical protein